LRTGRGGSLLTFLNVLIWLLLFLNIYWFYVSIQLNFVYIRFYAVIFFVIKFILQLLTKQISGKELSDVRETKKCHENKKEQ
jgi:hypothetical protein